MEEEFKAEENKKKAKFNEVQKANAELIQHKVAEPKKRGGRVTIEDDGGAGL